MTVIQRCWLKSRIFFVPIVVKREGGSCKRFPLLLPPIEVSPLYYEAYLILGTLYVTLFILFVSIYSLFLQIEGVVLNPLFYIER
jgi:hypothetical protein